MSIKKLAEAAVNYFLKSQMIPVQAGRIVLQVESSPGGFQARANQTPRRRAHDFNGVVIHPRPIVQDREEPWFCAVAFDYPAQQAPEMRPVPGYRLAMTQGPVEASEMPVIGSILQDFPGCLKAAGLSDSERLRAFRIAQGIAYQVRQGLPVHFLYHSKGDADAAPDEQVFSNALHEVLKEYPGISEHKALVAGSCLVFTDRESLAPEVAKSPLPDGLIWLTPTRIIDWNGFGITVGASDRLDSVARSFLERAVDGDLHFQTGPAADICRKWALPLDPLFQKLLPDIKYVLSGNRIPSWGAVDMRLLKSAADTLSRLDEAKANNREITVWVGE